MSDKMDDCSREIKNIHKNQMKMLELKKKESSIILTYKTEITEEEKEETYIFSKSMTDTKSQI